jgi:hypothetical protein
LKKWILFTFSFALLCVLLRDPLWFNELYFTTKYAKALTKDHEGLFNQPLQDLNASSDCHSRAKNDPGIATPWLCIPYKNHFPVKKIQ